MYHAGEAHIPEREATVLRRHSADSQEPQLSQSEIGCAVENFRRLSAEKASVEKKCQAPDREFENAAPVSAESAESSDAATPSENEVALTPARIDPARIDPARIDPAETDLAETDPAETDQYNPPLQGEILGGEVPDPDARVVTPEWVTSDRDRTQKRRSAARAKGAAKPPPARRVFSASAAAVNALLLAKDAATPKASPSSESKASLADAEADLTEVSPAETDQDEPEEAELVLAEGNIMPEGVASSENGVPLAGAEADLTKTDPAETDPVETDQDEPDQHWGSDKVELVLVEATAKPEDAASSANKASSADANQADAETDKDAADRTAHALSRDDAVILAAAFKTAKPQTDPNAADPDPADPIAADPLASDSDPADPVAPDPGSADHVAYTATVRPNNDHRPDDNQAPDYDLGLVEIHPSLPKVNPSLIYGATIALWRAPRFTPKELLDMIGVILEGTGAVASFDEQAKPAGQSPLLSRFRRRLGGPPCASLRVNGLLTLVGGGDKPAFAGKALGEGINTTLWSKGVECLSMSRGRVTIVDAHPGDPNDADLNYDRAVAVAVTAMAVSLLTDPAGIVWHPSGNATPPDAIPDVIQSLTHNLAPMQMWLGWSAVPSTEGRNPGAASRGLLALLGMELEMAPNNFSPQKTVDDLFEFAAMYLQAGKVPADGVQVATKGKTWYFVRHHEHGANTNAPVFRLTPIVDLMAKHARDSSLDGGV